MTIILLNVTYCISANIDERNIGAVAFASAAVSGRDKGPIG